METMATIVHFCKGRVKTITINIMHALSCLTVSGFFFFRFFEDCLQNKESLHSVKTENRTLC